MPQPLRRSSRLVPVLLIACACLVNICLSNPDAIDPTQDVVEMYGAGALDGWNENSAGDSPVDKKEIRFDQVISETAPPYPDVKPAPGTLFFKMGLDRFDGKRAYLPLFQWTWGKYIQYERRLNDAANGIKPPFKINGVGAPCVPKKADEDDEDGTCKRDMVRGHLQQITISGEPLAFMIPDQMYFDGPAMHCVNDREADSETINSNEEMTESEQSSAGGGYEMQGEVTAGIGKEGVGKASATQKVRNAMMVGTSNESKDYKKAASKGYTRSVFTTIKSKVWTGYLIIENSLSAEFKEAVKTIKTLMVSQPKNTRELNLLLGQLMFNFGTDYMVSSEMGGKIVKQTSAQSEDKSSVTTNDMKNANTVSMQSGAYKLDASNKASTKISTTTTEKKGMDTSTAKYYGGWPSTSYEDWCDSTRSAPYPLNYMTREVPDLMDKYMNASEVATAMRKFIYTRASQRETCDAAGAGLIYNQRKGECEMPPVGATCPTGMVKHKAKADFTYNGKLMYHKGQMICDKCAAGKEAKVGAAACSDCQPGYYAASSGTGICSKCPAGKTSKLGGTECKFFDGKFYLNARTISNAAKTPQERCALSGAGGEDDSGRGDKDCFNGNVPGCKKWAAMDCRTGTVKLKLKHVDSVDGHVYTIRDSKNNYLAWTEQGDASRATKFGAYWGDTAAKWLFYEWNGQWYISTWNDQIITQNPELDTTQKWLVPNYVGDSDKLCSDKCPFLGVLDGTNSEQPSGGLFGGYATNNKLVNYCGSIDSGSNPSQCGFSITRA